MNLLRRAGFHSVHAGQQELAHDIRRMLTLGGHEHGLIRLLGSPGAEPEPTGLEAEREINESLRFRWSFAANLGLQ
jgi:hypothetical protein